MARDKITVDLLLATKQAEREIDKINRKVADMGKRMGKSFGGMGGGTDKVRALGTGLSKATVKADEFNKSLEASNARVIAFGASAGLIMGVERALKAMVVSAVKVEKAMMDVSVVMQVSNRQLEQFGKGMFRVAKETAQGFDTVAEAATELARQGLGMEKTLSRAKDALILTRLTGMNAADSVKALTAAVNSFNKEGVTSTQIVNRMAKVDAAFAVSSEDLAKSISRVGASAISAGVEMNELMAITTAVQQKTARGGAVIGNAFKTIFTRIQRSDVQKKLRDMGIASTDMQGRMLNGMKVLQNMAGGFDKLTKSQQASLAENVAGVFQVNILKAALSDLTAQTSNYKGALDAANSATNEAYQRNEQLNQTLDALSNRTLANLTKAGSAIGGATLEPAIRKVLNSVNTVIDAFSEGGRFEKFGSTMGKGLLDGIGNFIKGPGLIIVGTAFMKLGLSLAKFAGAAFKDLMGLNAATKQRAALEEAVIAHIASEPALLAKVRTGTLNVLAVEQDILATVRMANAERSRIQAYARPLAGALVGRGMRAGSRGATMPGGAAGFVPNFASPAGERAAAAAGGYRAGSIKTMNQPGAGTMMYNSAETVKQFPGMSQSAIMPPQSSPAGAGYRSAFGATHGFDPYAGRGFVPNFQSGRPSKLGVGKSGYGGVGGFTAEQRDKWRNNPSVRGRTYSIPATDIGVLLALSKQKRFSENLGAQGTDVSKLLGLQRYQPLGKQLTSEKAKVQLRGVRFRGYMNADKEDDAEALFSSQLNQTMQGSLYKLAGKMMGKLRIKGRPLSMEPLSESVEGGIFEESMRMAMGASVAAQGAAFDFDSNGQPSASMQRIFGEPPIIRRIDAKRARHLALGAEMPKKYFNDNLMSGRGVKEIMRQREVLYSQVFKTGSRHGAGTTKAGQQKGPLAHMVTRFERPRLGRPGGAMGFVPNFSPLTSAIGREMQAGVPASAIRVGSSPALKSAGNPGGVGVYNTIHEPGGLNQGISRSRAQGVNPRSHGVPNFELYAGSKYGMGATPIPPTTAAAAVIAKTNMDLTHTFGTFDKATGKFVGGSMEIGKAGMDMAKASNAMLMASMMFSMAAPAMGSALGARPSTQGGISAGANILAMAGMGAAMTAGTGPGMIAGALGGAALGAITSIGDLQLAFGEEGRKADAKQAKDRADAVAEGLEKVTKALTELANVDFMTTEDKIKAYVNLQEKLAVVQDDLVAGGETTAGALGSFKTARGQLGSLQDFSKMTPSQRKDFTARTEQLITATRDKAVSTIEAPSQEAFNDLFGGGWVDDKTLGGLSVGATAKELAKAQRTLDAPRTWQTGIDEFLGGAYDKKAMAKKTLEEDTPSLERMTRAAFTPKIQSRLANLKGLTGEAGIAAYQEQQGLLARRKRVGELDETMRMAGELGGPAAKAAGVRAYQEKQGVKLSAAEQKRIEELNEPTNWMSGRKMMDQFVQLKDSGQGRKAAQMLSSLFKRGKMPMMSGALDKVLARENLSEDDFSKAFSPTGTSLGGGTDEESKVAYGIMQMVARGQEDETLPMFFPNITSQKTPPGLTDDQKNVLAFDRAASIQRLYDPIEKAGAKARGYGFQLQSNVAGRRRGLELGRSGRTRQAQLAGATGMFGNALFEETGRLKRIGAFDALEAAQRNIGDTERLSVAGVKETAAATYLKTLQEKEIETGARGVAQSRLGGLEAMSLDQKRDERYKLRMSQNFNKTEVGAAQIAYLTTVIEAETKAREIAVHKGNEAIEEYDKQNKEIDENVEHLKKMKEAARHFYEGSHIDAIKDQRSRLRERIVWEEKQVELGRLNAEVLHESKMKLEDFNRIIEGTGNHLKLLDDRFQTILSGSFSEAELVDAAKAGKGKLNQQIRNRQTSGLGATAALRNAKEAYDANLITADELRAIKANARLNTPGATGNPMEAFRDQFLYNGRDAMLDFENGVIGVADTMKSSFSEAFRSLTSGASTAKEAFAGMAVSILDSISNMSSQMATKMLFNQMNSYFGAQGGLVPRYNQGGVVTGGSGHKDDVLSMMSGGEFVIKKSSAQKIGYGTLDAINSGGVRGYQQGGSTGTGQKGPGMGTMFAVSAGASALSGLISQQGNQSKEDPWRGQDYGFGRGKYGHFGGPEYDAGGASSARGGANSARVSLDKRFAYYRRDPQTGRLISERARPTEGRYEVSSALSLRGRLNEDDPRTSRMFGKERALGSYQDYLHTETERRKDVIEAHEKKKKGRLMSAYVNAAMLIGGSYMMGKTGPAAGKGGSGYAMDKVGSTGMPDWALAGGEAHFGKNAGAFETGDRSIEGFSNKDYAGGGSVGGSAAMLMGGEYVMSPQTVRTYGAGFMQELNRGNVPQMAGGGFVGNQGVNAGMISGGETNNNVNISVNVDKRGSVDSQISSQSSSNNAEKQSSVQEAEKNKQLGVALKTVVLQEIIKQQRPGGLLQSTSKFGRQP